MKPFADFLNEVLPSVPGCPFPTAINAIRNSAIEFLKKTGICTQSIDIALEPGKASYPITPAAGTAVVTFIRGLVGGLSEVAATAPSTLDASDRSWRVRTGTTPVLALVENGALTVTPVPTQAGILAAVFTSTVSRAAAQVDDFVLEDWAEAIASGALYRLMEMPGYVWTNPELSMYHKSKFNTAVDDAVITAFKGSTNASLRAAPRRFG